MQKIILASRSPRRSRLLQLANISFEVNFADIEETYPEDLLPEQVVMHIARNKAISVINKLTNNSEGSHAMALPVLSADTIVVLNNTIIGKPADRTQAIEILHKLSGNKHLVITGVVILYNNAEVAFADTTEVEFHDLTMEQIAYYVDNYKPFDKAGAYAIQEWIGAVGIKNINGDFYNVMGLPVSRVFIELQKMEK